jgi:hypothetical protein
VTIRTHHGGGGYLKRSPTSTPDNHFPLSLHILSLGGLLVTSKGGHGHPPPTFMWRFIHGRVIVHPMPTSLEARKGCVWVCQCCGVFAHDRGALYARGCGTWAVECTEASLVLSPSDPRMVLSAKAVEEPNG